MMYVLVDEGHFSSVGVGFCYEIFEFSGYVVPSLGFLASWVSWLEVLMDNEWHFS